MRCKGGSRVRALIDKMYEEVGTRGVFVYYKPLVTVGRKAAALE